MRPTGWIAREVLNYIDCSVVAPQSPLVIHHLLGEPVFLEILSNSKICKSATKSVVPKFIIIFHYFYQPTTKTFK